MSPHILNIFQIFAYLYIFYIYYFVGYFQPFSILLPLFAILFEQIFAIVRLNMSEQDTDATWAHIRLPPFMIEDPEAFIALLEAQFRDYRITSQMSRYNKLLAAIPPQMLGNFRDIFMQTPENDPYDVLKNALLHRTAASEEKRIQHLLSGIQLGSMTASQLLRQMRNLAGKSSVDDAVLRQIWLQRLPPYVQSIVNVFIANHSLEQCAEAADRAMEGPQFFSPGVASATHHPPLAGTSYVPPSAETPSKPLTDVQLLCQELRQMSMRMSDMQVAINNLQANRQPRGRSFSRSRRSQSRNRTPSRGGVCYYHRRFKSQARKCEPPCSFNAQQGN